MGRASEEVLATVTGLVILLVFGGILMAVDNPRIMTALQLTDQQSFVVMITAATVFAGATVTTIVTVVSAVTRRKR